ncbi:uncharacterized protein LOC135950506 [Calliphora vicina]|uniref:uncharacterized protein LOC135950506 n=1 Tax=Calliphora vicina TaxID=7373 RepID=UPI00325B56DD
MNTKLKNSKSRMTVVGNGIPANLKHLQGLRNILLTATKPTKYIVTLKPRGADLKSQTSSKLETQKVIINAEDLVKGKSMLDTNFIARSPILEKIEEESENSASSVETENYDLNLTQSITDIYRLRGGWGLANRRSSKKNSLNENESNNESDNELTTVEPEQTIMSKEDTGISLTKESSQVEPSSNANPNSVNGNNKMEKILKEIQKDVDGKIEETKSNNEFQQTSNNDSINGTKLLKPLPNFEGEFEHKEFSFENNNQTNPTKESELNAISPTTLVTSSFVENLLEEIVKIPKKSTQPSPSLKCELKDLLPICEETTTTQSLCDLLDINSNDAKIASELFCILPSDEETCKRIYNLENQVEIIHLDLKELQKELVPSDDLAKFSILSKRFNEVNALLADLKLNCLKLQNMELQRGEEKEPNINEEFSLHDNQPLMDISYNDYSEEYLCSRPYLETCNCGIYQTSQAGYYESDKIKHDLVNSLKKRPSAQRPNCNNFMPDIKESSMHYIPNNIDDFEYPQTNVRCSCCKNCQLYTEFNSEGQYSSADQTTNEQSGLQTPLAIPPINEFDITRTVSHNIGLARNLTSQRAAQGADKYVFDDGNTSLVNSMPWNKTNMTKRQSNKFKTVQATSPVRYFNNARQLNTISPLKRDSINNYKRKQLKKSLHKENHSVTKSYNTKTRNSVGRDISSTALSSADAISYSELPIITNNLCKAIWEIIGNIECENIVLTVFLETNNLYYINVSITQTGQCLECIYTNEAAFREAKKNRFFEKFLTFFVLNSKNTLEQRNKILGHSFEFINTSD